MSDLIQKILQDVDKLVGEKYGYRGWRYAVEESVKTNVPLALSRIEAAEAIIRFLSTEYGWNIAPWHDKYKCWQAAIRAMEVK